MSVLFIAPAWPRESRSGLSMRVWAVSQALGQRDAVKIWVPAPDGLPPPERLPANVTAVPRRLTLDLARRVRRTVHARWPSVYPRLYREPVDWPGSPDVPASLTSAGFRAVHVCRFVMAPYAEPFLGRVPCYLDLDESESRTRAAIAALMERNGERSLARMVAAESRFFARHELNWLRRFDGLSVSSAVELAYLKAAGIQQPIGLIPNTVPSLPAMCAPPPEGPPLLLFVGTLTYYPNADAVRFFLTEILPAIRRARPDARVLIVGRGPAALRKFVNGCPGAEWLGFVPELAAVYQRAHGVIAPIRAGGGTRIKILEAFAYGRAVVSTSTGAEGIEADSGVHLLVEDGAAEFAAACLRLIGEPDLRDRVTRAARQLLVKQYGPEAAAAVPVPYPAQS